MISPPSLPQVLKRRKKKIGLQNNATAQPQTAKNDVIDTKKLLDTSAQMNRNLFVLFNLLLAVSFISGLSISDEQLLVGTFTMAVPLIGIQIPIWTFASVTPLLVLIVHFDVLHNLNEHSRKLKSWITLWEKILLRKH